MQVLNMPRSVVRACHTELYSFFIVSHIDCGNYFSSGATNVSSSDCDMPCDGNAAEFCGAGNRLDIFWSGTQPPSPPIMPPSVGNWSLLGCYRYVSRTSTKRELTCIRTSDSNPRTLSYGTGVTGSVSIETCTTACYNAGYPLAGTEYSAECCRNAY
jgi:hypothetical protein